MQSETWPELWTRSILHKVMIPDLDINRSANPLIQPQGGDALIEAAMRADKLMGVGQISLL